MAHRSIQAIRGMRAGDGAPMTPQEMPPVTYQVADLVRVTGVAPKWISRLTDVGALRPEPGTSGGGSGRHRRYGRSEMMVCTVLADLVHIGVTISTIQKVADAIHAQLLCQSFLQAWSKIVAGHPATLLLGVKAGGGYDIGLILGRIDDLDAERVGIESAKGCRLLIMAGLGEAIECHP